METETIRNIISKGEGLQVEFKKALSAIPSDAYETIVSFSNTQGGTLLLGVNDDGTVVGVVQTAVQKMLKNLVSALNAVDNIYPPLYLQPTPHEINGKTIIILQVPISSQVHKLKQKHIFIREVIGNVIVHREYQSAMATQLVIENNQVILTNPNNPHGHGPIDLDSFNPHPKNPNIRKFFTAMGWTDEIGSGIRNTKKYLPLYVEDAKPQFIENHTFTTIIPLKHATLFAFANEWMQWMDFDSEHKPHIEMALKKIPLKGSAIEMSWNQLIAHLVSSWNQKGIKLHELDWPKKQLFTKEEIKKVSSWNEKGTKLLHKKSYYLISVLMLCAAPVSLDTLMLVVNYSNRNTFNNNYMKPLAKIGFVSKTNPENPRASNQKYYTTEKGILFLTDNESK